MDRISDSGSDGCGSIPHGGTRTGRMKAACSCLSPSRLCRQPPGGMPSLPLVVPGDLFAFPYFAGKIPGPVARLMAQSLRSELSPSHFVTALKRTDIDGDKIYITTQKTNDRLPIDLSINAKAILEKYKDEQFPLGLALPVISNQKMNHYLKDLGELCGFTTPITIVCYRAGQRVEETYPKYSLIGTHAARRTFICFALSNGVSPQVVMKWTGHSDYKAMRPYIDIAEKTKADAMKLIDNAWGM